MTFTSTIQKTQNDQLKSDLDRALEQLEKNVDSTLQKVDNYLPVQYNTFSSQYQKVAQTFRAAQTQKVYSFVMTPSFGTGNDLKITLRKWSINQPFETGELVFEKHVSLSFVKPEKEFFIALDMNVPVELVGNQTYVLVIEPNDKTTQTGVGFSDANPDETGDFYTFTRLVGGNGEILDSQHTWQLKSGSDMVFRFE